MKSLWKERQGEVWSFYCPLCKAARRVPYRSRPGGPRHFGQVLLTAVFFTLVTWKWFEWKGIVSFLPFWTAFEVFYRWRLRTVVACPQCGFDAYLYLTDVKRARKEVEFHWRKIFSEKGIPYPEPHHKSSGPPQKKDNSNAVLTDGSRRS